MKGLVFFIFLLFFSVGVQAQAGTDALTGQGDVVVHTDPRLALLLKKSHPVLASSARLPSHKSPAEDMHLARVATIHPTEGLTAPHPGDAPTHINGDVPAHASIANPLSVKPNASPVVPTRPAAAIAATTAAPAPPARSEQPSEWAPKFHVHTLYSGKGYRVQIYYGPDRAKAIDIKNSFSRNNPGVRTYLSYISPCFRVKVGNYRNRSDAEGMWREANSTYNPSMIVPDIITITTLE